MQQGATTTIPSLDQAWTCLTGASNCITGRYRAGVTFISLIVLQQLQVQGVIPAGKSLQVGKTAGEVGGISRAMREAQLVAQLKEL